MLTTRIAAFAAASLAALLTAGLAPKALAAGGTNGPAHGIAMHGAPKYAKDYKNYDYVNASAPKGGKVVLGSISAYDTLNAFIVKGVKAAGIGSIYESLMVSSLDEAFSEYCHLCETVEVPDDRSWVEFTLRRDARWHDGKPLTVDDVIWTFETLREKGTPGFRAYYKSVAKVEKTGANKVKFSFEDKTNLELPLIMGQLTVLPRHYWEARDFTASTMDPPLGSGPYKIKELDPGRSITYERVKDYWGAKLPTSVGFNNFDAIRYDTYRDATVMLEAFKGGNLDYRGENVARNWATAYDTPAVRAGLIQKDEIKHSRTQGMQAFVFNTRKAKLQDPRLREAVNNAFDYEWTNANIFFGAYTRSPSYWSNSALASFGKFDDLPQDSEERKILEGLRGKIPAEVFTKAYLPPKTDGSGNDRNNLRSAGELLDAAGWVVRDGKRVNSRSGQPLEIEFLLYDATQERYTLPFVQRLERLGIVASVRTVDVPQYQRRMDEFDFDITTTGWGQSESPGNEQRGFWGSASAAEKGSSNTAGIKDPVIDELIELVISAPDRKSLVERTRALDRVLLWGHYVVPQWHLATDRLAYWDHFGRPEVIPSRGTAFGTWWVDPAKDASLAARRAALR
ncbi:MAG: ABC transporter substrate-binding protein [Alphaproteobacteria bacterium]|nr:ABC transporter substrate-binding protein [Alphaproteobacteria bacterium]